MANRVSDSDRHATVGVSRLSFAGALLLAACGGNVDNSDVNGGGAQSMIAPPSGGVSGVFLGAGGSESVGGASALTGGMTLATDGQLQSILSQACSGTSPEVEVTPALLYLVIDISESMDDPAPGPSGQSKWQITQAALANAIGNQLSDNTGVGILLFPDMGTVPNHNTTPIDITNCVNTSAMIPVAPLGAAGSQQRSLLAQGLANAYVAGGRPTDDAYEYAYVSGVLSAMQVYGYFTPFIVLITDGQPTISRGCEGTGQAAYPVDWQPIFNDITAAFQATPIVKTFIIGLPGSEAQSATGADGRQWLSSAARAGGTALTSDCQDSGPNYCHYDLTQSQDIAADLATAFNNINQALVPPISCSYRIPPPPDGQTSGPTTFNVIYQQNVATGTPTQQWIVGQTSDTTCAGGTGDGWYIDSNSGSLVLCPKTCRTVQSDKYARLLIRGLCAAIPSPPT